MVRVIRNSNKKNSQILFPGPEKWEVWNSDGTESPSLYEGTAHATRFLKPEAVIALPIHDIVVLPLWLATQDPDLVPQMAGMQLEKRGLIAPQESDGSEQFYAVPILEHQETTLVTTILLAPIEDRSLANPRFRLFYPSFSLLPLPQDHFILWRELGRWAVCLTRGAYPIFLSILPSGATWADVVSEIKFAIMKLEMERLMADQTHAISWSPLSNDDVVLWEKELGFPIARSDRPRPSIPLAGRNLVPKEVRAAWTAASGRRRSRQWVRLLAAAYLVVLAFLLGDCLRLLWTRHQLEREAAKNRPAVETLKRASDQWLALEDAIEPRHYPLEILYHCVQKLPSSGVRLVTYSLEDGNVLLEGEAKTASLAFEYVESLKKDSDLVAYAWGLPSPKLLPNNSAQFMITGKSRYASHHGP